MHNRRKFLIALWIGALLVVSLLTYLVWLGYQEAIRVAVTKTHDYAAILEARLAATLRRTDGELQQLARAIPTEALSQQAMPRHARDMNSLLRSYLPGFPELASLRIFDANGEIIYFSDDKPVPQTNISDRSHFRKVQYLRSGLVFSEVIVSRITGRPGIFAVRGLRDELGIFRGALVAAISLEYFEKLFQALDVGPAGNVAIYRSDDFSRVLRWPPGDGKVNAQLPQDSPTRMALGTGDKSATIETSSAADGMVRIYSYQLLESYPFFVSVGVAHDDALAAWRHRSLTVGAAGMLLVALLIGLQYRLWRVENERASLAAIVNFSSDAIISRTPDGTITSWNASAERLFGYTRAEAMGQNAIILVPPDRMEEIERNGALLTQSYIVNGNETVRIDKHGKRIDVSLSRSPIRSDTGAIVGVSLIFRDITKRKLAEAAVRDAEQRMRLATEATGVGVWEWNILTDKIRFDVQMFRIYGITPTADGLVDYGTWSRSVLAEDLSRQAEILQDTVHRLGHSTREFRICRADDGECRYIHSVEAVRTNAQGQAEWVVGTNLDITERKRVEAEHVALEAQLRESQKMEAVGTLAGGIAHDFNNIIATILGNAELALEDVTANPRAQESIVEIRKAARRARDLVQQILSFSRRQPIERKPIALAPVVDESARLLRATLPQRVSVDVHCDADVPQVLADANQIQQVVINLATNAMQAMKGRPGRIEISLETVMLDAALVDAHPELRALLDQHPGRTVRLAVSDDGPGMDAATLARIFEPFFTTKPINEGTGLGLSVVHGIVQTHEGAILVESEPGKGAHFTVYLPVAHTQLHARARDKNAAVPVPAAPGGKHVLYLDDEEALVFLVKRLLERGGHRVSGYTNQQEALAALRADPASFDLVLTDYNMPGMSGLDVAREVRLIRADLPVAVASGFVDEALQEQAGAAGVREVIFKVTELTHFCTVIERLMQTLGATAHPG